MIGVAAAGPAAPLHDPRRAPTATAADGAFADVLRRAAATTSPGAPSATGAAADDRPAGLAGRTVLDRALLALGRSGRGGASLPADVADPAAFVAAVFAGAGVIMPPEAAAQAAMGVPVASLADARSGDLVVVGEPPMQVGLYAGRGRMVHAPAEGGPVQLSEIAGPVTAIRRIVTDPQRPATPTATTLALLGSSGTPRPDTTTGPSTTGAAGAPTGPGDVPYRDLFVRAGTEHGIEPALLAAVARAESGFDPAAVSPAGAQGLMQFMPGTAASLGVDPWDPSSAITGAARYLRQGLDRFGTVELALAAYNAGPGAVQRHGGVPPYRETRDYVRKVLDLMEQYRR